MIGMRNHERPLEFTDTEEVSWGAADEASELRATDGPTLKKVTTALDWADKPASAGPPSTSCSSSPACGHDPNCATSQNDLASYPRSRPGGGRLEMHASDWTSIATAATAAIAVILSYLSYRRTQDIRREELYDRRTAQARLITAWWTGVDENDQDVIARDAASTVWPEDTGYRILGQQQQ